MKKKCILGCGHLVGGGGDRHATGACPPKPNYAAAAAKKRKRQKQRKAQSTLPVRGEPVAGIHKQRGPKGG
ncbi:MAG: hypothetical protein HYY92_01060 [Parcubacteria group bacterium]|nr:hypothetical protein [Parcubacteria group bacterium]